MAASGVRKLVGDGRDEVALQTLDRPLLGQVAERVDDPFAEGDTGDGQPDLPSIQLERQRLGANDAAVPPLGDGRQPLDVRPARDRVDEPPREHIRLAQPRNRLCGRVPEPDNAFRVEEEDPVADELERTRRLRPPLQLDLGLLRGRHVAERPEPAVVVPVGPANRRSVPIEDASVLQEDLFSRDLLGVRVEVLDAGDERVRILHLLHRRGERGPVVLRGDELLGEAPQLGEAGVVGEHPPIRRDQQKAVERRFLLRFENCRPERDFAEEPRVVDRHGSTAGQFDRKREIVLRIPSRLARADRENAEGLAAGDERHEHQRARADAIEELPIGSEPRELVVEPGRDVRDEHGLGALEGCDDGGGRVGANRVGRRQRLE